MTLPSSGPLTLANIQTEFGGSNPISLSEYYAGGAYVPAGTTGTYGAVPSSGTISIRNFYGTSNAVVNFSDAYPNMTSYFEATTVYQIYGTGGNIGKVYATQGGTFGYLENWVSPTSAAGDYEVYVTLSGSALYTGTLNSWVACSGSPSWSIRSTGNQVKNTTLSFQVRKVGTTTVLDTWTVYLYAESYL
jgi:hypothetical protein